jgi:hypothetical protein
MLATLQRLLDFKMTIAEWLGTGIILGIPYLALGMAWSMANAGRFDGPHGPGLALRVIVAVLCWPALLLTDVCVA